MRCEPTLRQRRDDAIERDAIHQAVLRLAGSRLPQGYLNEALREHLDPYHADEQARERLGDACGAWMGAAARQAGGLANVRRQLEADAEDGMQFALVRGLSSRREVEAYRIANPMFRQRYDDDLAFQHGVAAGVWANRE